MRTLNLVWWSTSTLNIPCHPFCLRTSIKRICTPYTPNLIILFNLIPNEVTYILIYITLINFANVLYTPLLGLTTLCPSDSRSLHTNRILVSSSYTLGSSGSSLPI